MTPASSSNQDDVDRARAIADDQAERHRRMVEHLKSAAHRANERRAEYLRDAIELLDRIHELLDSGIWPKDWIDTEIMAFIRKHGSSAEQLLDLSDGPVVSAARGTGTRPEQGDAARPGQVTTTRAALERQITGALKSCIAAHGPITTEYLSSASKRVVGVVLARDDAEIPDPNRRFADRLRIEGDSTYRNTRVLFDGEQLHGVKEITWALLGFELASVTITFLGRPEIDVKP